MSATLVRSSRSRRPYRRQVSSVSLYFADPDDNQMEFQVETYNAQEQAGLSPEIKAKINGSIGVEFDPDFWLDQLKAGIP